MNFKIALNKKKKCAFDTGSHEVGFACKQNTFVYAIIVLQLCIWQTFLSKTACVAFIIHAVPQNQTHDLGVDGAMMYCLSLFYNMM